jgi:hypothetical protein
MSKLSMSEQFVFDLAKSDLACYYKQCINGIEEVRRKIWEMLRGDDTQQPSLTVKDKLLALKLIKECDEGKFALFKDRRSIMNVKSLEETLSKVESGQISSNNLFERLEKLYPDTSNKSYNDGIVGPREFELHIYKG